jgi:hypothetical protein
MLMPFMPIYIQCGGGSLCGRIAVSRCTKVPHKPLFFIPISTKRMLIEIAQQVFRLWVGAMYGHLQLLDCFLVFAL